MLPAASRPTTLFRRRWTIRGQVQGIGFRPFVVRLARRLGIHGFVRNDSAGVTIEAQGTSDQLERFAQALQRERPALAVFHHFDARLIPPRNETEPFGIEASDHLSPGSTRAAEAQVTVDLALCPACRRELFEPHDPRHRYGLINCTDCGPRYTIQRRIPYDRPNTTMASFAMCDHCRSQYADPLDRRFHAQPIACPVCGPQVTLVDSVGQTLAGDPYHRAAAMLRGGQIVAIKGLGGFHLAVRADQDEPVQRLRRLKARDAKPFALMAASLQVAQRLVRLSPAGQTLMQSPACPIVLAERRPHAPISAAVAEGSHRLGVMLPHTPIQHLLFAELASTCPVLVMTSGNTSDEPLALDNDEALRRLGPLVDAILWHDRPIERRVDDSILLDGAGAAPLPIRRARGYAPASLELPLAGSTMGLCVGGELKSVLAVVRSGRATLSQHLGDLQHALAFDHFRKTLHDLLDLFEVRPQWIACDLHPLYLSTQYAREMAARLQVPLIAVQHHHAHAASVLAEHGHRGPALAIVCDGVGHGEDGASWGGELLLADLKSARRLAHLRPLRLAGGDAAARDTRRCGLALLAQALGQDFDHHPAARALIPDAQERQMLALMVKRNVRCTPSSAAGRVFDGVAAILGLCAHNDFEAQAAQRLESAAAECPEACGADEGEIFELTGQPRQLDLSPLIQRLLAGQAAGRPVNELAAWFHEGLALAWATTTLEQAQRTGIRTVALSGGVFCNEILSLRLTRLLAAEGLHVLHHRVVPPNDGGLALGQAAVAAARSAG